MTPRRVVLVVGPPVAGVDGVIAALGRKLPEHVVVGLEGLGGLTAQRAPDAVLAVVSAVAPVTRTDWDLIERAATGTELVIAVVSKIDAHRGWREVMDADRVLVTGWTGRRRPMPWVGVAAAPDLGEPALGELVALLREHFANAGLEKQRNVIHSQPGRETSGLGAVELRTVLQRTRLGLLRFVRDRCSAMRAELREDASAVPVGGTGRFEARVQDAAADFLADLDDEITRAVAAAAVELAVDRRAAAPLGPEGHRDLPDLSRSPSSSRRLEGRLMAVLGVGFGLGIALAASRLLAGLARGPSLLGLAAGLAVGLALLVWVVRTRGLLHDRALLDRWVTEVAATLRWHGEAAVAERLLVAESGWLKARRGRTPGSVAVERESDRQDVTDQYEW